MPSTFAETYLTKSGNTCSRAVEVTELDDIIKNSFLYFQNAYNTIEF